MMHLIQKHMTGGSVSLWTDILLFKISWIALVLFQDRGVIPALVLIGMKVLCWPATPRMLAQSMIVLLSGIGMDLVLSSAGVFNFGETLLPIWLAVLWLAFALTMPRGFAFIGRLHPLWQSLCGIFAGLAGYFAGYLVGAVDFDYSLPNTAVTISLCWAVFVPLQFFISRKLPGA
jgi:hypothetical protein